MPYSTKMNQQGSFIHMIQYTTYIPIKQNGLFEWVR